MSWSFGDESAFLSILQKHFFDIRLVGYSACDGNALWQKRWQLQSSKRVLRVVLKAEAEKLFLLIEIQG